MKQDNEVPIKVIVPCYNAAPNLITLAQSVIEQDYSNWSLTFIDDLSTDNTKDVISKLVFEDSRLTAVYNVDKRWALKNITESVQILNEELDNDIIVVIVDGDDKLCNSNTFKLLNSAFNEGAKFIWTKHKWEPGGQNISNDFPKGLNPYQVPWVTSHLRAFSMKLFCSIPLENFKDAHGEYFKRGYDQAISLPLLTLAGNDIKFIDEVCYQYNIDSVSMPNRNDGGSQLNAIKFIRARGFVSS